MEEKDLLKRVEMLEKQQRSLLDSFSPIWHDYHKNGGLGVCCKKHSGYPGSYHGMPISAVVLLHAKNIC